MKRNSLRILLLALLIPLAAQAEKPKYSIENPPPYEFDRGAEIFMIKS